MGFRIVKTKAYYADLLTNAIDPALAAPLKLAGAKQGIGQAVIDPSFSTVIADVDECDFTGYSQSAVIVWGPLTNEVDGSKTSFAPSHLFRCTADGAAQVVNNGFVTDGGAGGAAVILGSYKITPGITIEKAGDGFSVTIGWNEGVATPNSESVIAS